LKIKTQSELVQELRDRSRLSTQKAVAEELGIHPTFLSDVLKGKRDISANLAERMGFQREVVFRKVA